MGGGPPAPSMSGGVGRGFWWYKTCLYTRAPRPDLESLSGPEAVGLRQLG